MPIPRTSLSLAIAGGAAALAVTGCGGSKGDSAKAPPAPRAVTIDISDFKFHPADVTVAKGAKVTFVERDSAAHTATSDAAGAFDTGVLRQGQRRTLTLTRSGRITYHCDLHPFMKAALTVGG